MAGELAARFYPCLLSPKLLLLDGLYRHPHRLLGLPHHVGGLGRHQFNSAVGL